MKRRRLEADSNKREIKSEKRTNAKSKHENKTALEEWRRKWGRVTPDVKEEGGKEEQRKTGREKT